MLKTEEVELIWVRQSKKYYIEKGYIFTNYGDSFIAKVEDLSNGCLAIIEIQCDYCGKVFPITYHQYYNMNKNITNKDCCNDCKHKKAIESSIKVKAIKNINSRNKLSKESQEKFNYIYETKYKVIDESDIHVSGIYRIVNKINRKVYIGSAINLKGRKNEHINKLSKNKHHSIHLQRSWNKYGEGSFEFEIIEYIEDKTQLIEREQYWIDFYQSYTDIYGYNMRPKAESPLGTTHKVSDATKIKISLANTGRIREDMRIQNNNRCLLTKEQVYNLKIDLSNGIHPQDLSIKYNIKTDYIYDIAYKRKFKYILPDLNIEFERKLGREKLNKDKVKQIRSMLKDKVSFKELAILFNISERTIKDINDYRTWKNVI